MQCTPEEVWKTIREKGRRGRTGYMFLVSVLLITLPWKVGKNITEKGRRGRAGTVFLVSMLLIPLLRRQGRI